MVRDILERDGEMDIYIYRERSIDIERERKQKTKNFPGMDGS